MRTSAAVLTTAAAVMTLAACGHPAVPASASMPAMAVPGTAGTANGSLASSSGGYTLVLRTPALPAGRPSILRFEITAAGKPVTKFEPDMTKLMHLYLIRSDLTGFQHVHPVMAADGTWSVRLAAHSSGSYRMFTTFTAVNRAGKPAPIVLSAPLTIPGTATTATLPPPTPTATIDGYTLTLTGTAMAGTEHTLTITITKDGRPVTSLQPYLDSYAHLTAFRQGNLAFAHLHPEQAATSGHGGPALTFHTMFTQPGNYRLFLQFQTDGTLHTAAFTLPVS
jgi:hypothetical protein